MPHDIVDKFSTHLKNVLTRALCFVVETNEKTIKPEHLLWALGTQRGCIGEEILKKGGVKQTDLRTLVNAHQRIHPEKNTPANATLHLSNDARRMVEKAVLTANIYGHRYVGTEHLLSGILQVENETIMKFFLKRHTDIKELRDQLSLVLKSASKFPEMTNAISKEKMGTIDEEKKLAALEFFGKELTTLEAQQRIDPVIGREREIERLMQVLCRRTKNNPLLLGAPGVGKTAIVEGLAKKIVEGAVPSMLQHKRIFALDMALLIAGTMYRGEFEGRLRQVVDEVKQHEDIILFIDEIHTIVGAGAASGSMDAANILKPALARGDIRCIGATTLDEYKKHLESDSALERRFQSVLVEEPSAKDSERILEGITPYYESFHRVRILPDAIASAVQLSQRYIQDRQLPDKAIDLIDEAAAAVRIAQGQPTSIQKRRILEQELERVRATKRQAVIEERFQDAMTLKGHEDHVRRSIESAHHEPTDEQVPSVTAQDIAQVIARATGIPLPHLHEQAQTTANEFYERLCPHILGQTPVLKTVSETLSRIRSGLSHPKRPLTSFLFAGPSGVGKTELAKAITSVFFHDPKNLIRLDMSEYTEGFTVSKLIGSPAGYIGYKDQSKLTDRVRQKPYSVILFDEMEKAHPDVQNLLLQILEEGELTDATGRMINFKNTMIVLTTNGGSETFERGMVGFAQPDASVQTAKTQDVRKELEERFRPELINRIENVCLFESLTQETLMRIIEKELLELTSRLHEQQALTLTIHPNLSAHLAKQLDLKLGARSVRQTIQQEVETRIAERLSKQDRPHRLHAHLTRAKIVVSKPRH